MSLGLWPEFWLRNRSSFWRKLSWHCNQENPTYAKVLSELEKRQFEETLSRQWNTTWKVYILMNKHYCLMTVFSAVVQIEVRIEVRKSSRRTWGGRPWKGVGKPSLQKSMSHGGAAGSIEDQFLCAWNRRPTVQSSNMQMNGDRPRK